VYALDVSVPDYQSLMLPLLESRYTKVMSAAAKQIVEAALKLDPAERVHVAELIWESVDDQPTENVEQLWREELARRRQKIESGQAQFFSVDEVKAEAQKILRGR
jgi:putative addiction module component (TIGR02574 family)